MALGVGGYEPSTWQPQEEGLWEVCGLLELQLAPTSYDKSMLWQRLQHYSQFPDFNNYLAFILAHATGKSVEVRQAAGLLLKNNLRSAFKTTLPANQQYIKSVVLPCMGAADRQIRSTAGTIISTFVQMGGVAGWLELLYALVKCLDSNDVNHMEGAMDALSKVCEDAPRVLNSDISGLTERPINAFLPRFLQLFHSPHSTLRKLSLGSVNQYIEFMPAILYLSMDKYWEGLFVLANDPTPEVRKLVCTAFLQLIKFHPAVLEPHLKNVIEYMLLVNKDPDEEVALEACEFWSSFLEAKLPPDNLREFLPRLIPILLSNMAYADDDEALLEAEEDGSLPDRDQDLKPHFHSSRCQGSEDVEDGDDDVVNIWNLRKCSTAALDVLSNAFGDEILPTLMPIVQAKLSATGDEAWKDREAAFLALGAISDGCSNSFRYTVQGSVHQEGCDQFDKVLMGLLGRILDDDKRVQEAAYSAFTKLEVRPDDLLPRLDIILQYIIWPLGKYQRRNLKMVYDTIGILAVALGMTMDKPKYIEIFMPPLIAKLQQLSNSDKDLFPLLECFTSIAQALDTAFSQFAPLVFQRCINIIQTQQLAKVDPVSAGAKYDKELMICALDLLSRLAHGLGPGIESLVSQSNLSDILLRFCVDDAYDVRRRAFALLRDLARVHKEISAVVLTVISCLVPILQHPEGLDKSLIDRSAIALGRLAWVFPEVVSPYMEHFMQSWCIALSMICDDDREKDDAFRGLCALVRANPSGALTSLVVMCKAIASCHDIMSGDTIYSEICRALQRIDQVLTNGRWEQCMSALEPSEKDKMLEYEYEYEYEYLL